MTARAIVALGVTAAAAVTVAFGLGSAGPARAAGPPADGTYAFTQSGVSGVTWTVSALCDPVSGSRYYKDYSNPDIQDTMCALNVVSTTSEQLTVADRNQNFSGRARLVSGLWTFQVQVPDGVSCPDGSTAPSSETYAFDDATLTGTHTTVHGAVCGAQPGMSKQPFSLALTGPPPSPIQRYPLHCNDIAACY